MTALEALDLALRLSAAPALWSNVGSHVTLGADGAEVAVVLAFSRRAGRWVTFQRVPAGLVTVEARAYCDQCCDAAPGAPGRVRLCAVHEAVQA